MLWLLLVLMAKFENAFLNCASGYIIKYDEERGEMALIMHSLCRAMDSPA